MTETIDALNWKQAEIQSGLESRQEEVQEKNLKS
jgi:hypothetical protein